MRPIAGWICSLVLCSTVSAAAVPQVVLSPAQPAPGEVFRVTVDGVASRDGVQVRFAEREFPLWQRTETSWEGLAAVDRDQTPGEVSLQLQVLREGAPRHLVAVAVTVLPKKYPEQHLKVQEGMVHLSAADQERADRENRRIREVIGRRSADKLWQETFEMPVSGPVTGAFGVRRVYNGTPKGYHSGTDLAVPRGTPVAASGAGQVVLVGDYFYTGKTVFVDHGLGLFTAYFHLDAVTVDEGQRVAAGSELGRVGSTGRSTGPHLHWGVYLSGGKADPLSLLQAVAPAAGGDSP